MNAKLFGVRGFGFWGAGTSYGLGLPRETHVPFSEGKGYGPKTTTVHLLLRYLGYSPYYDCGHAYARTSEQGPVFEKRHVVLFERLVKGLGVKGLGFSV